VHGVSTEQEWVDNAAAANEHTESEAGNLDLDISPGGAGAGEAEGRSG
jgi:hypothetical protein